jgi:hypothetical protein
MTTSKMEALLDLGSIQTTRIIPGTQATDGREFRYVSDAGMETFGTFFKKLIRFVSPPIPKDGGALIEGCKITLPDGEIWQAISYKGDIEGWRQQVEQGAKALGAKIARIDGESIVLNDAHSFRLADCKIEFE